MYSPIGDHVERMMKGETNPPGSHSRERWAAGVVRDLLKPHPNRYIRRGFLAWTMMIVSLLMPVWLMDRIFSSAAKLSDLKRMLQSEDAKKQQESSNADYLRIFLSIRRFFMSKASPIPSPRGPSSVALRLRLLSRAVSLPFFRVSSPILSKLSPRPFHSSPP